MVVFFWTWHGELNACMRKTNRAYVLSLLMSMPAIAFGQYPRPIEMIFQPQQSKLLCSSMLHVFVSFDVSLVLCTL